MCLWDSCMSMRLCTVSLVFFFFNDTATTEIYTLSLHDALPICSCWSRACTTSISWSMGGIGRSRTGSRRCAGTDRKSTRLNSSHGYISYAVFCLKNNIEQVSHAEDARRTHDLV